MLLRQIYGARNSSEYKKFVDINQNIDKLHDSELTSSSDAEKVKLSIKLSIKLNGVSLNRVNSTKFLCVITDENLTWKNYTDAISKTISRNIGVLTKLKHCVPENILYSLYCYIVL